jgi:uncharacterized protein YpuA (DUF1002 family)
VVDLTKKGGFKMIRKTITIDEDDYYKICNQLESIYIDASQTFNYLDDKEKAKGILKRIFDTSYKLMKDLEWVE